MSTDPSKSVLSEIGRMMGRLGGAARAKALSPERRKQIARMGAKASALKRSIGPLPEVLPKPDKMRCRALLAIALYRGELVRPKRCEKCHRECTAHGHHSDYTRPLQVEWLCGSCHQAWHGTRTRRMRKRPEKRAKEST